MINQHLMEQYLKSENNFLIIAGPCSIESEAQMNELMDSPAFSPVVRGGLYKMRTNPDSFQGMREKGVELVAKLKTERDFDFVTEISDPRQIELLDPITSVYQVGTRNMYNYELLKELSTLGKPVLLKRGFSATLKEWIGATEYLSGLSEEQIILCERGIRAFEPELRNHLDLGSVIWLKENTNFKVIVDPSHAMGHAKYVRRACLASIAAGADGILVEVHPEPAKALSDAHQALNIDELTSLRAELTQLGNALGKEII